jgi:hypothetical protein
VELSSFGPEHKANLRARGSKAFAFSGGWGTFEGSNALGFGAIGRVSDKVYLTGGVGMGLDNSTVGGRAGFLLAW